MLEPFRSYLATRSIILASGSPRRKEILQNIGLKYEVVPSTFEENLNPGEFKMLSDFVIETAKQKTLNVIDILKNKKMNFDLVIGADTIVTLNDEIFGKPKSKNDAFEMLTKFSNQEHEVITGVCLATRNKESEIVRTFYEKTCVLMAELSSATIKSYIDTGEPLDKAGAYAIQGIGGSLIKRINGDYYNVVGLPLCRLTEEISTMLLRKIL